MALIKCHECGNQVSTEAAACPACGAKPKTPMSLIIKFGGGFLLFVAVIIAVTAPSTSSKPATDAVEASNAAEKGRKDEACRNDLQCWGEKGISTAHVYCKDPVERMAAHSVKWTDEGMFDHKFSRFKWLDQERGLVTYFGDKAQFQNGFGAYTNVVYSCDVDVANHKALKADLLYEGRLPE